MHHLKNKSLFSKVLMAESDPVLIDELTDELQAALEGAEGRQPAPVDPNVEAPQPGAVAAPASQVYTRLI